jgi:SPP1 gp7 family putative phage head morphogenesis protein
MNFAFDPIPHAEAAKLIRNKPAVIRDVFDEIEPALRLRAFLISGIEDFDVLQAVRDQIATLPEGADWRKVRKEIAGKISPWLDEAQALRRAELLMSHHGFSAYAACQARIMDEMIDVFPYRQYLSTGDGKVRATHRALHGLILPAASPFWHTHTPPWEFGCRCQVVELTAEDAAEQRAKDAKLAPEHRLVQEGPALARLEAGRVTRGPSIDLQLAPSLQSVRDYNIPYADIAARWDAPTRTAFEAWAAKLKIGDSNLLAMLGGKVSGPRKSAPKPAAAAPKPAVLFATMAEARQVFRDKFGVPLLASAQPKFGAQFKSEKKKMEHLQTVAGEFDRMVTAHPGLKGKLAKFNAIDSKRGRATLDGPAPQMSTKAKEWDEKTWKNIADWEAKNNRKWGTERKGSQVRDNFRHELGHTLSTPKALADFRALKQAENWNKDWFKQNVSEYAGKNDYEAIAESFGIFTRDDYQPGTLPQALENFLATLML